jgi:predicted transposase/invertase (TIGR01784 family)
VDFADTQEAAIFVRKTATPTIMTRYLTPMNDLPFKKIFGEHKDLLISFLNALLPLQKGLEITGIEYLSPEQVPRTLMGKNSIVDVMCTDNRGRYFIVEMQMAWSIRFSNRLIFNASKAFVYQFDKKKVEDKAIPFSNACPVYSLAIVNKKIPMSKKDSPGRWYHHCMIADVVDPEWVIEGIEYVVVELPNFKPETWSQTDKRMAVLWLRFLKELNTSDEVAEELLQEKTIGQAVSICEMGAYTNEELKYYDAHRVHDLWEASYVDVRELIEEQTQLAEECKALDEECKALDEERAKSAKLAERIAQLERQLQQSS